MFLIFLFFFLENVQGKDPSNFKNNQLGIDFKENMFKMNEFNKPLSKSIKIDDAHKESINNENNGLKFFNFSIDSNERLSKFLVENNKTSQLFFERENKNSKIKEPRAKPLLNSMIDTLNVINSLNKTNQPTCDINKCVLNCELQDSQNNGKLYSGFCNSQATNICQCCNLKHQSCIETQRKCKAMGLKAICNKMGECNGSCTCTINSCLQFCMNKEKSLIKSNITARMNEENNKNKDLFYTNSITASATCFYGQCICNTNENTSENEDKPDHEINTDEKLNPIYLKMFLNNRRSKLYDSLQINFSNMLRMIRLMVNSFAFNPNTYGLNILKPESPSSEQHEKDQLDLKYFQLENSNIDIKKEILKLSLNKTLNSKEKSSFLSVLENRFEIFRNQRNMIISKLDQLVAIEKKANRKLLSQYLNDIRTLLLSNLYLNREKIENLLQSDLDNLSDIDGIYFLTLGISNSLELVSINLT